MSRFAENLRARRAALGLTQEELAEKLHVTRQAVSNWENGKHQPDLEMLALLSYTLEADVSALLGDQAPPRSRRRDVRRAGWFAAALAAAVVAFRLPLPYLTKLLKYAFIGWPYLLYFMLLHPLLWILGGWTLAAVLCAWPGVPPMHQKRRRVLFWCGLGWCLVWLAVPLLSYVLSPLGFIIPVSWMVGIMRRPWLHLPGALAMALGVLQSR